MKEIVARKLSVTPDEFAARTFGNAFDKTTGNAIYCDSAMKNVVAVSGLKFKAPVVIELLKNEMVADFAIASTQNGNSLLFSYDRSSNNLKFYKADASGVAEIQAPYTVAAEALRQLHNVHLWAGQLNSNGEHEVDLLTPAPGPHFNINLLMGNRVGYAHALQTTPKSVVDRVGGGSFRSHAATQVLATRWDMRQEENGFPANRQFYIIENNQKIFYSAEPTAANIESAKCIHGRNHTRIEYKTRCGLTIKRLIFILPQYQGLPLATEVQRIEITNNTDRERDLRIVYTGMFGNAQPMGQWEDVLYTNVIMQSRVLQNDDGSILAVGPDYYPPYTKGDQRFHTLMVREEDKVSFATEFCMNYNEFVGAGSLQEPQSLLKLSNNLYRKGPGFFAVAANFKVAPNTTKVIDNFTGLVSDKTNPSYSYSETYASEIQALVDTFKPEGLLEKAFASVVKFLDDYSSFIQLNSSDAQMNAYFNKNLPFQVLYQTFVSRSFCQTQKGYRELGFREIQDIFASMYYFVAMGMPDFVKQLLKEWCSMVFEFGYAYHNFFWVGKEPGKWSDDALWFIQAVYRYINLTGDLAFLDEEVTIAGTDGKTRPVYETIKAILTYSSQISIGKHGIPLIDSADWNDCLKVDDDFIDGPTKEKRYKEQIAQGGKMGDPFKSDYSESVMNGFLLKLALDETLYLANEKGDTDYVQTLKALSDKLHSNLQAHAWKEDFFARVLLNRYADGRYTYLGAKGDGFSIDPEIDGVYFLNSFSWSVLSDVASDAQTEKMLDVITRTLKTPFGLKLVSPSDLGPITRSSATDHYFPGDRENGGVFKHACMMTTSAMFKAAKKVKDPALAQKLTDMAYWMLDIVLPFKTMENPYVVCGNPRFCTQYNNSDTGENIGPMLSGTSTWLILTLMNAYGIEYTRQGIIFDPILKPNETMLCYTLNTGKALYNVKITKESGFKRIADGHAVIRFDGVELGSNMVPVMTDGKEHSVEISL
jgi:cellobiose phosphorylase